MVLAARFICCMLMHLQVEADIRQGLKLMKYACNHPNEFLSPFTAFMIPFMQTFGGLAAEIACIVYLCTI